jgi:uncharacterized membrane protein SpoIIM required for sporulation
MKKLLIPMVAALAIVFSVLTFTSWYLSTSPNMLSYSVYIDQHNRIFINGEISTEDKVYRLARDMTVNFEIKKHNKASLSFCFQERGCIEN